MTSYLDYLLWGSLVISIITSLMRAANIGFQRETYAFAALSLLPIIYDAWFTGSIQLILYNIFHLLVAVFGAYRWWNTNDRTIGDEERGYRDKQD